MTPSVGTYSNGSKTTRTKNLHPSVTSRENLRSIGCQMRSQCPPISVRGQKVFLMKKTFYNYFLFFYFYYYYFFLIGSNGPPWSCSDFCNRVYYWGILV